MKRLLPYIIAALIGSASTIIVNKLTEHSVPKVIDNKTDVVTEKTNKSIEKQTYHQNVTSLKAIDFSDAAQKAVSEVVHIKATIRVESGSRYRGIPDLFRDFFGDDFYQPREQIRQGSGSGVIISDDGYIVTNHHVIQEADEIEVVLNDKRSYKATLIGQDPSTDLALLKVDDKNLPYMTIANSADVNIGDWVLAVGNPFNLSSTVTAGIVSAKARSINILQDQYAIESFIQTDAAVNPGNSGGALVDLNGRLIGINSAIASPTGSYAGYSFAIPSDIVKKVVEDLKNYGMVQRAYLGVIIREMNAELAGELQVDINEGVLIDRVGENSAAEDAGIKANDIIIKIDDSEIKTSPELLQTIGSHRPGDKVVVKVYRDGELIDLNVTLKNKEGNIEIVQKDNKEIMELIGAELENVTEARVLNKLNINGGVRIKKLKAGKLKSQTSVREGFIIIKANRQNVSNIEELTEIIENVEGGVMFEGVYPDRSGIYYYAFGL